jgi:hypothetical protein
MARTSSLYRVGAQAELDDVSDSDTPTTLYHYTTAEGLNGILENHSVWASSINFLNDSEEFQYAFEEMVGIIGRVIGTRWDLNHILDRVDDYLVKSRGVHVGVFSLSEEKDLLSQWRAYAQNGFAIGFNVERLQRVAESQGYTLAKCIYKEEDQHAILRAILEQQLAEIEKAETEGQRQLAVETAAHMLLVETVRVAPLLKNKAFSEEKEWRLISGVRSGDSGQWQIRVKRSHFVPYLELPLGDDRENSPITKIVLGPNSHFDLARLAMGQIRHTYRVFPDILETEVPYRTE